jgi:hypothetical protein
VGRNPDITAINPLNSSIRNSSILDLMAVVEQGGDPCDHVGPRGGEIEMPTRKQADRTGACG